MRLWKQGRYTNQSRIYIQCGIIALGPSLFRLSVMRKSPMMREGKFLPFFFIACFSLEEVLLAKTEKQAYSIVCSVYKRRASKRTNFLKHPRPRVTVSSGLICSNGAHATNKSSLVQGFCCTKYAPQPHGSLTAAAAAIVLPSSQRCPVVNGKLAVLFVRFCRGPFRALATSVMYLSVPKVWPP